MKCNIGYGLLLDGEVFNQVRKLELELFAKSGSSAGLTQDPHITVKRPFEIEFSRLSEFVALTESFAATQEPFSTTFTGYANFATSTLFLKPKESDKLKNIHMALLQDLEIKEVQPHMFDGENVVFHTTLAMDLQPDQFELCQKSLVNFEVASLPTASLTELGLFMQLEQQNTWEIIARYPLGRKTL